jgi:hypothetical protein
MRACAQSRVHEQEELDQTFEYNIKVLAEFFHFYDVVNSTFVKKI